MVVLVISQSITGSLGIDLGLVKIVFRAVAQKHTWTGLLKAVGAVEQVEGESE